eukprot:3529223-Prymnesium_polylepis.1
MPKGRVTWSAEGRESAGFPSLVHFFHKPPPPPQVGRPAGATAKKRGRPPNPQQVPPAATDAAAPEPPPVLEPPPAAAVAADAPALAAAKKPKAKAAKAERINWGKGEALEKISTAVADFDGKTGAWLSEDSMTFTRFCQIVDIPYPTLAPYVCKDKSKRKVLGCSVGRKALVPPDTEQFAVDVLRRKDRANDGMSRREGIDMLQDLQPVLSRKQAEHQFDSNVRGKHKDELTGIVKASATTEKRCAITVPQQFRWHSTVDGALAFLRERNTGLTPDGKTFGEVIDHFVAGGDETCLLASDGEVKIIGDKKKIKHD